MVRQEGGRIQSDLETKIATGVNLDWTLWWVAVEHAGQLYEFLDSQAQMLAFLGSVPLFQGKLPRTVCATYFGDNLG
jgi:hypothetical protein